MPLRALSKNSNARSSMSASPAASCSSAAHTWLSWPQVKAAARCSLRARSFASTASGEGFCAHAWEGEGGGAWVQPAVGRPFNYCSGSCSA